MRETAQLLVPGAIAGFARPGACAKVEVDEGVVMVTGKFPGTTDIILVTRDSIVHLLVTVLPIHPEIPERAVSGWSIRRRRLKKYRVDESNSSIQIPPAVTSSSHANRNIPTPEPAETPRAPATAAVPGRKVSATLPAPAMTAPAPVDKTVATPAPAEAVPPPIGPVTPSRGVSAPVIGTWAATGTAAISLQAGQVLRVPAAGATAAYALESLHVEVALEQGFAVITGKFAGHSQIIIVTDGAVRTIPVEVTPAPPIYPAGFVPPVSVAISRINGAYEVRYFSPQEQVQNLLDYTVQGPRRSTQLHLLTSTSLRGSADGTRIFLPSVFYRIRTQGLDLTLLDQPVKNSPLTVNGSTLRGLHAATGRWRLHGGYATLATFHGFLLPIQREAVAGLGYVVPLTEHSWLTPNFYYFFSPAQSFSTGHRGAMGSLVYEYQPNRGLQFLAEIAEGHGFASALELHLATRRDELKASYRQKPKAFPSLSIDNLPGLQAEIAWARQYTAKLANNFNFSENRLLLPFGRQSNLIAKENFQARLTHCWSVSTGISEASFSQSGAAGVYSLRSLNLPETINFDLPHFGAGFMYQYSRNSHGFSSGNQLRQSFRADRGALSASVFAEHQTQGIAVESLYSQLPSLQAELLRLGLAASTPQQVQALLEDTSFLLALGLSPGDRLHLVPSRTQTGGNMSWTSRGVRSQQLAFAFLRSWEKTLLGSTNHWEFDGSYSLQLSRKMSLSGSFSVLHLVTASQAQYYPQAQIALRRNFSTLPALLSGYKSGIVSGTVFEDEEGQGKFRKGLPELAGLEVILDNTQRTETDAHGFYIFRRVAEGQHSVEVRFQSSKPFWFTGPSKFVTNINQERNIGIRFAAAELVGYLKNDAGSGVEGVHVLVAGKNQQLNTQSDAGGRFSVRGLSAGEYDVTIDPNSLPAGYMADSLKPQRISIENGTLGNVNFLLTAFRSLRGQVTTYDTIPGKYVPAPGVPVELGPLARRTTTNSAGKFDFQDLPAGEFTLIVGTEDTKVIRSVSLSPEPGSVRVDIKLAHP